MVLEVAVVGDLDDLGADADRAPASRAIRSPTVRSACEPGPDGRTKRRVSGLPSLPSGPLRRRRGRGALGGVRAGGAALLPGLGLGALVGGLVRLLGGSPSKPGLAQCATFWRAAGCPARARAYRAPRAGCRACRRRRCRCPRRWAGSRSPRACRRSDSPSLAARACCPPWRRPAWASAGPRRRVHPASASSACASWVSWLPSASLLSAYASCPASARWLPGGRAGRPSGLSTASASSLRFERAGHRAPDPLVGERPGGAVQGELGVGGLQGLADREAAQRRLLAGVLLDGRLGLLLRAGALLLGPLVVAAVRDGPGAQRGGGVMAAPGPWVSGLAPWSCFGERDAVGVRRGRSRPGRRCRRRAPRPACRAARPSGRACRAWRAVPTSAGCGPG